VDIQTDLGRRVFGAAAIALGLAGLYYRDFATVWQPVPAETPGYKALAIAAALLFLASGLALQSKRWSRFGAAVCALLYAIFTILWARRIIGFPQIFATWGGTAEELALVAASVAVIVRHSPIGDERRTILLRLCTATFGVCAIAFGFNHFFNMTITASMVPSWIPPSQWFWALATGLVHVAGGIALLSGFFARPGSRLLVVMYIVFGVVIWAPRLATDPGLPITWTGNAVNLALIGAAWIIAETVEMLVATRRLPSPAGDVEASSPA